MKINKLAWVTDVHLDLLDEDKRYFFFRTLAKADSDAILITGDIAETPSLGDILHELCITVGKPVYFVLGNHDYYHSDVASARAIVRKLCSADSRLHWLGAPEAIPLNDQTLLVGQDGWADARYGDFEHSTMRLQDSELITDLAGPAAQSKAALQAAMQKLADADAEALCKTLGNAVKQDYKKIIIATHVPPFPEVCRFQNKPSNNAALPFFASKATGDVIAAFAKEYPGIDFLVLCGHTHHLAVYRLYDNLQIKVGDAKYSQPDLQEIINTVYKPRAHIYPALRDAGGHLWADPAGATGADPTPSHTPLETYRK